MTAVNLLLNLKSMLESEFERLVLTGRNKEIEKQPLKADSVISIDKNAYSKPNVYVGFRPVSVNQYDFPAVVIVPPVKARESQEEKEYDIKGKWAENEAVGQFNNIGVGLGMISGMSENVSKTVSGAFTDINSNNNLFCKHCGKKLESDSVFCSGCGKKVN